MTIARLYPTDTTLRRFTGHESRRSDEAGIESLTSLLCRLALEHCCAPHGLYGSLAADNWDKEKVTLSKIRSAESQLINSLGDTAKRASEALKKESDISNPAEMTFLSLSNLCDKKAKHFLHKIRHWCPQCYLDARCADIPAWDPLYWSPSTTTVCVIHKTALQKTCPECTKVQRYLPKFPFLDFCEYCGSDLTSMDELLCEPQQLDERMWFARGALELIQSQHEISLSRENFSSHLSDAINMHSAGQLGLFAKITGIKPWSLRNWQLTSSAPTWSNFMDVSYRLNVPPAQIAGRGAIFFDATKFNCNPTLQLDKQHNHLPKKKLEEARNAITKLLNSPINVWTFRRETIFGILKQFDICYQTFQRNFSDLFEVFSKKRKEAAEIRKGLSRTARIERVRSARIKLEDMSLTPSVRNLKKSGMVKVSDVVPPHGKRKAPGSEQFGGGT
jgi:small nuclear ribonucleoprotein (snRNP)-like protein